MTSPSTNRAAYPAESLDELAAKVAALTPAEHGFAYFDPLAPAAHPTIEGDLSGWIIPAKDLYEFAGMPTTFGSRARTIARSTETNSFIAAYQARGAAIPGKSVTSELGMTIDAEPRDLPALDNPIWPGRTPGGSSGGAAVMVARGLVRAAHASDAGGSIRIPSAACGVVGFKPASSQIAAHGFITRRVEDSAYLHQLTLGAPTPRRVGLLTTPLLAEVDVQPEWERATREAAEALAAAGHDVVEVGFWPAIAETFERYTDIFSYRLGDIPNPDYIAAWLRKRGLTVSAQRYAESLAYAATVRGRLRDFYGVDALLTPTVSSDPPAVGAFSQLEPAENFAAQTRWASWTSVFNIAGAPAISLPWPVPGRPQPAGVHLAGLTLDDAELLTLARELHE
ncbi:amidase [Corynebacterium uterequi]|uniref:amidase n=1 Tax=Corynebacterium uterequi TaxID=1072256 RepID=A0A0G3HLU0_9CORY|nr:amidase [Corynebacterium uterequi]AKK12097.1 amidase, Asp-tRNAAsn/Glu-tRNAGln amidotransferase A subunit [Corynebacterium uterequi]